MHMYVHACARTHTHIYTHSHMLTHKHTDNLVYMHTHKTTCLDLRTEQGSKLPRLTTSTKVLEGACRFI